MKVTDLVKLTAGLVLLSTRKTGAEGGYKSLLVNIRTIARAIPQSRTVRLLFEHDLLSELEQMDKADEHPDCPIVFIMLGDSNNNPQACVRLIERLIAKNILFVAYMPNVHGPASAIKLYSSWSGNQDVIIGNICDDAEPGFAEGEHPLCFEDLMDYNSEPNQHCSGVLLRNKKN